MGAKCCASEVAGHIVENDIQSGADAVPHDCCSIIAASDTAGPMLKMPLRTTIAEVKLKLQSVYSVGKDVPIRLLHGSTYIDSSNVSEGASLGELGIFGGSLLIYNDIQNSKKQKASARLTANELSVTVRFTDHDSYKVVLQRLTSRITCRDLKRKLAEERDTPYPCVRLMQGNTVCQDSSPVSNGEFFEMEDLALDELLPLQPVGTTFTHDDFIFPDKKGSLNPKASRLTLLFLKETALRGDATVLADQIDTWPLGVVMSPTSLVSCDDEERECLNIPPEAVYFAWFYPASTDWTSLASSLPDVSSNLDVAMLRTGGYGYFDSSLSLIHMNTIVPSSGGLSFCDAESLPPKIMRYLWKEGRVARVTLKFLNDKGISHFAWIVPNETFDGESLYIPMGAFAYFYHSEPNVTDEEASGDIFFAVIGAEDRSDNLAFFDFVADNFGEEGPLHPSQIYRTSESLKSRTAPDAGLLPTTMQDKKTDWVAARRAAERIRDPTYTVVQFHKDCETAFPELVLYTVGADEKLGSGRSAEEEYLRTIGALFAVYWLMRVDIDGKSGFSFGAYPESGELRKAPNADVPEGLPWGQMSQEQRRINFAAKMSWDRVTDLFISAGLLKREGGRLTHDVNRTLAMLVLTAIHDIMKNTELLPYVQAEHAPYADISASELITDHDLALGYILENFKQFLPSYRDLEPVSQKVILFTQGKMCFNNGWLVQAEAAPGPLFETLGGIIKKGGASDTDVAFYFVHWLTDLGGAVPKPYEGMVKYVCQFPDFVLRAFMDSFPYLWKLGSMSPVAVYLDYLCWRWKGLELGRELASLGESAVAVARLCVGVQTPVMAQIMLEQFLELNYAHREILTQELGKTGMEERYPWGSPDCQKGPCFLCYYGPALLVQHCENMMRPTALEMMAEVYRAGQILFPPTNADERKSGRPPLNQATQSVTLDVAAMKEMMPREFRSSTRGYTWVLVKNTEKQAAVQHVSINEVISMAASKSQEFAVLELWPADDEFSRQTSGTASMGATSSLSSRRQSIKRKSHRRTVKRQGSAE